MDKDDFLKRFSQVTAPDLGGFADGRAGGSSIRKVEGQVLYRTCKVFGPRRIIETGTHTGCSTNYLLAYAGEEEATVFSFDVENIAGKDIREEFKDRLVLVKPPRGLLRRRNKVTDSTITDIREKLTGTADDGVDLFLHDSDHRYNNVRWEYENITPRMKKGAPVVIHDVLNRNETCQTWKLFEEITDCSWKHIFDTPNGLGLVVL